jgi:hypothetical protein
MVELRYPQRLSRDLPCECCYPSVYIFFYSASYANPAPSLVCRKSATRHASCGFWHLPFFPRAWIYYATMSSVLPLLAEQLEERGRWYSEQVCTLVGPCCHVNNIADLVEVRVLQGLLMLLKMPRESKALEMPLKKNRGSIRH